MSRLSISPTLRSLIPTLVTLNLFPQHCLYANTKSLDACESALTNVPSNHLSTEPTSDTRAQVHQFIQFLIDTQNAEVTPIERRLRLLDARRVFSELTTANSETAQLIRRDWLMRQAASARRIQSRRGELLKEIQVLEQEVGALREQSLPLADWSILKDSNIDPTGKFELQALLRNKTLRASEGQSLEVRTVKYVVTGRTGALHEFDAWANRGHSGWVRGAQELPSQKIISWSADHTLIIWKIENDTFVVDQRLGKAWNKAPKKGHVGGVLGVEGLSNEKFLTWSSDHTLILWTLKNNQYVISHRIGVPNNNNLLKGHTQPVLGAKLLSDGRILSWANDRKLIVWRLENDEFVIDQKISETRSKVPKTDPGRWITGIQILNDESILTWTADHTLIFWKLENGLLTVDQTLGKKWNTAPVYGHTAEINQALVLPNGSVVSSDKTDRHLLWGLTLPDGIQSKLDDLSQKLDARISELIRLEAKRTSLNALTADGSP